LPVFGGRRLIGQFRGNDPVMPGHAGDQHGRMYVAQIVEDARPPP
jgi:hypothetical protein